MVGNGRYRAPRQSKTQSKHQSTLQSMSPVQSPGFAPTPHGPGSPVFQRATLKNCEEPGDEATGVLSRGVLSRGVLSELESYFQPIRL